MTRSGKWFDEIISRLKCEIYVVDQYGLIKFSNRKGNTLFNIVADKLIGTDFFDLPFYIIENQEYRIDSLKNVLSVGANVDTELGIIVSPAPGYMADYKMQIYFLGNEDNVPNYQITLTEYRAKIPSPIIEVKGLFSGGSTVIFKWRPDYTWIIDYVSPNVFTQFGYTADHLIGQETPYDALIHPDDLVRIKTEVKSFTAAGLDNFEQEYRIMHANGSVRYVYDFTSIIRDETGKPISFQGTVVDITDKKQALTSLKENLARFNAVIEGISDAVIIIDHDYNIQYCNSATTNIFGWEPHEIIGKPCKKLMAQQLLNQQQTEFNEACFGKEYIGLKVEADGINKKGETIPLEVTISSWKVGDEVYYGGIITDLTERKRNEQKIKFLATIPEYNKTPIVEFNSTGIVLYANPTAQTLFPDLYNLENKHPFLEGISKGMDYRDVEINGSWYRQSIHYILDRDVFRIYSMDITENVATNRLSKLNQERLQALIEALPDAIILKDGLGKWKVINSVARKLFRLENKDWVDKSDHEIAELSPELFEYLLYCEKSDKVAWDAGTLSRGEEIIPDDLGVLHHYEVLKVPVFNELHHREALVIVGRDVSERKKAEIEQQHNHSAQQELNRILKVSLNNSPVKDNLNEILEIVLQAPFIDLQYKGGIFLSDESREVLTLTCQINMPEQLQKSCANVRFGECICGKAALGGKTIFTNCINHLHEKQIGDIQAHGHYNVPIIYQGETLGVIVVYLNHGHIFSNKEVQFLEATADVIAGMLNRKKAEAALADSVKFLEGLDKVSDILQRTGANDDMVALNREMLQVLLNIFGSDRAWLLYPCDPEAKTCIVPMEVTRPEFKGAFEIGAEMEVTPEYAAVFNLALSAMEPFGVNEQEIMQAMPEMATAYSIKAGLGIAVHPKKGKPWLLGLHQCSHSRNWTEDERRLFKQIAERFARSLDSFLLMDKLRKSESQYRLLAETAHDMIVSFSLDGNIDYMNNVGIQFFGLTEQNYRGRNIFEFIPEDSSDTIRRRLVEVKRGYNTSQLIEVNLMNGNGAVVPFEVNSSLLKIDLDTDGIISVSRDITERKNAERILRDQNAELQVINSELDRFVYSASHDLRAPLTSVLGLINITQDIVLDNADAKSYLGMMKSSILKLDNVIKGILEFSRTKRIKVNCELLDIKAIYEGIVEGISYIDGFDSVAMIAEIDSEQKFASDKLSIVTILSNLITNAVKYRREQVASFVKFVFRIEGPNAVFTVEDNGEGIPEDKFQQVFEMFYRNTNKTEGSGLGLYIVKQNVIKLEGTITLESKPGVGSKFIVVVPNKYAGSNK